MRILCLHGMGTNSQIFEAQTTALRRGIRQYHNVIFDFVEGGVESPPAPEILNLVSSNSEFYAYYDPGKPESITEAVDNLLSYVQEEGPYDGVMAFSQGAVLAAMLLTRNLFPSPFAFAIFICGGPPFAQVTDDDQLLRYLNKDVDGTQLHIPTLHIVGARDEALPESVKLAELSSVDARSIFDHGGGHEIPTTPQGVTTRMVDCVNQTIAQALRTQ